MTEVESFSKGKIEDRNEDYFDYNESCFAIADGATDKSGRKYDGKSGGEIVSRLVVKESLPSELNGVELINNLNKKIHELYIRLGIADEVIDAKFRFTCCCVVARIVGDKLIVTCLGDTGIRINGTEVYIQYKQVDIETAEVRSKYVLETGDIEGSRNYIMPLLLKQFEYQNNTSHPLGYGVIDGTETPSKFIRVAEYPLSEIKTLELFTDGYFAVPNGIEIKDWEYSYQKVEKEDPDKYIKYKSTKSEDDRTIAIVKFINN